MRHETGELKDSQWFTLKRSCSSLNWLQRSFASISVAVSLQSKSLPQNMCIGIWFFLRSLLPPHCMLHAFSPSQYHIFFLRNRELSGTFPRNGRAKRIFYWYNKYSSDFSENIYVCAWLFEHRNRFRFSVWSSFKDYNGWNFLPTFRRTSLKV